MGTLIKPGVVQQQACLGTPDWVQCCGDSSQFMRLHVCVHSVYVLKVVHAAGCPVCQHTMLYAGALYVYIGGVFPCYLHCNCLFKPLG